MNKSKPKNNKKEDKKEKRKNQTEIKSNTEEIEVQYILDTNNKLAEIDIHYVKSINKPINYKLENIFEVFVQVEGTENYWISNYGRCVNNLDTEKFNEHEQSADAFKIIKIGVDGKQYIQNTTLEDLVADTFLVQYRYRCNIWHKDGDVCNNWYKNLLFVTPEDYEKLKKGEVTWQRLGLKQDYIEYKNKASSYAYKKYYMIKKRCKKSSEECYRYTTMCEAWMNDPKSFVKWYLEHYYVVKGESMAVDKDLFGNGVNKYAPDHCCLLPQGLNTLLTNCKRHYSRKERKDYKNKLPLGVRMVKDKKNPEKYQYQGQITYTGDNRPTNLSLWDTEEEAFKEYKLEKQNDILRVANEYKEKIPEYIYDALLKVEVKAY